MFECKHCIEKQKQIDYLQKLVDKLLVANGVAPVADAPPEDLEPPVDKSETLEKQNRIEVFEYGGE